MEMLIAILSCVALQRFVNIGGWFQPQWFVAYLKLLNPWLSKLERHLMLLVILASIWLGLAFLKVILSWPFHGIFNLLLSIAVVFFCIDTRYLKNQLETYFDNLDKGDTHNAACAVTNFIDHDAIGDMAGLQRAVSKAILSQSFTRFFAGLFWYIFATKYGIYGITTYFVVTLLTQHATQLEPSYSELVRLAENVKNIMEWLPARFVGLSYALVGNFAQAFTYCKNHLWSDFSATKTFVVESGIASLNLDNVLNKNHRENHMVLDLVDRCLTVWLIGMALVLFGRVIHIL